MNLLDLEIIKNVSHGLQGKKLSSANILLTLHYNNQYELSSDKQDHNTSTLKLTI